jgi:GNAT superfamily N-acetyltransferase
MAVTYQWRGEFQDGEVNELHSEAFESRDEWNWRDLVDEHSLGWVLARQANNLIGFVNVIWDGRVHAWIQDTMVATQLRGQGVGTQLVTVACDAARDAGCEWLHVDFDEHLRGFYLGSCGFNPSSAGVIALRARRRS